MATRAFILYVLLLILIATTTKVSSTVSVTSVEHIDTTINDGKVAPLHLHAPSVAPVHAPTHPVKAPSLAPVHAPSHPVKAPSAAPVHPVKAPVHAPKKAPVHTHKKPHHHPVKTPTPAHAPAKPPTPTTVHYVTPPAAHSPVVAPAHTPFKPNAPLPSPSHYPGVALCIDYCDKGHKGKRVCFRTCTACYAKTKCVPTPTAQKKCTNWDSVTIHGVVTPCP